MHVETDAFTITNDKKNRLYRDVANARRDAAKMRREGIDARVVTVTVTVFIPAK